MFKYFLPVQLQENPFSVSTHLPEFLQTLGFNSHHLFSQCFPEMVVKIILSNCSFILTKVEIIKLKQSVLQNFLNGIDRMLPRYSEMY